MHSVLKQAVPSARITVYAQLIFEFVSEKDWSMFLGDNLSVSSDELYLR